MRRQNKAGECLQIYLFIHGKNGRSRKPTRCLETFISARKGQQDMR